jgi:hypothetical protein
MSSRTPLPGRIGLGVILAASLCAGAPGAARAATSDPDFDGLTTAFETNRSLTDPALFDSDLDGVGDGSEDPDNDHLTNLWEQRLKLDPLRTDSDGNGVPDNLEDPDKDRIGNRDEIRSGLTDPRKADSDRDAIRDGAEDPDGDGLSNAGEALFRLKPNKVDTDGDGIDDWHEDSDLDGRTNGLEQDQRPVPANLKPTLADASTDRPRSYGDGCHVLLHSTPVVCDYGVVDSPTSVLLFGDSHAAQWLPALEDIAGRRSWHIISITKSACPPASVTIYRKGGPYTSCDTWRTAALNLIDGLTPTLVVASGFSGYKLWADDAVVPADQADAAWSAGLLATLVRLRAAAGSVLVLGDTPRQRLNAVTCLGQHLDDMSRCVTYRSTAVHTRHDSLESLTATTAGVTFASTSAIVCPYDPCPVIIDRYLIDRDAGHLVATWSRHLGRALELLLLPIGP